MKPISSMPRSICVDLKVNHGPRVRNLFGLELDRLLGPSARPLPYYIQFVTHVAVVFPFGQA